MTVIYAFGSNGSGQLGIGHKEDVSVPKEVIFEAELPKAKPVTIKSGGNHTLILSNGKLYCSGDYSSGACGLSPDLQQTSSHFRSLLFNKNSPDDDNFDVTYIAATWEATIIVKKDHLGRSSRVYCCGTGNKGELGLGEFIFRTSKPQLMEDFPPPGTEIVDLAGSVQHVIVVLDNGDVYGWGSGRKGQLCQPEGIIYTPKKLLGLDFEVQRAVCGREFSFLIGISGMFTVLGTDKWDIKSSAPENITGWRDVSASWGSISVLLKSGKLLSWGRNDHGQCVPIGLPDLLSVSLGSEHSLALTTSGDVLAWGWGEHGNCGPNMTLGDVKGRWNTVVASQYLPEDSKISSIASGYATSWICLTS